MRKHPWFIPSLRYPLLDLAAVAVIFVGATLYHARTDGRAQMDAAQAARVRLEQQDRTLLSDRELDRQRSLARFTAQADSLRRLHAEHAAYLRTRIAAEGGRIDSLRLNLAPLESAADSLLAQLEEARLGHNGLRAEVQRLDDRVAAERAQVQALALSAGVRQSDLRNRGQRLAALGEGGPAGRTGIGMFFDRGETSSAYFLQVTRGLVAWGPVELGLAAALGSGGSASGTSMQGGLFARSLVFGPRWKAELAAGLHRSNASHDASGDRTRAFYGAALRFAPLGSQRLWLTLGLQYRRSETAGRFGIAWDW